MFETFVRKIDKRKEVVHHIDGDPKNNTLENLKVMTRAEHNRFHKKDKQHPKRKKVSKDEFKMKKRDYDKKYYQKNKEKFLKRSKEYYQRNMRKKNETNS